MSQQMGAQLLGTALAVGLQASPYANTIMAAYGLWAQLGVLLPYRRLQESEADRIGLVLAAKAGYDAQAGIRVWQRMAKLSRRRPPPFLSTHPTPESRIEAIKQFLPQAMAHSNPQGDDGDTSLPTECRAASRGAKIAQELLGEGFWGCVVTDRWSPFSRYPDTPGFGENWCSTGVHPCSVHLPGRL
jgi:predicted Zn-dependent protease